MPIDVAGHDRLSGMPSHPWHQPRVYAQGARLRLLDPIRNQLVPKTPEEMVRQQVVHTLISVYGYPPASLSTETLVERGSKDRRRADIVVRLGQRCARPRVSEWLEEDPDELPYSAKLAAARVAIPDVEVSFFDVPDEFELDVDGAPIRCRTLGFDGSPTGILLHARPVDPRASLPAVLSLEVAGWARQPPEAKVAARWAIPDVLPGENEHVFVEGIYALTSPECPVYGGLSTDGTTGLFLTAPAGQAYCVLGFARLSEEMADRGLKRLLSALPSLELADGQHAYRHGLDRMRIGDRVHVVSPQTDEFATGSVVSFSETEVVIRDLAGNRLTAQRTPSMKHTFLAGRVEPPEEGEPDAPASVHPEHPFIVVECKAPGVSFSDEVVQQALGYAESLGAPYVLTTNGIDEAAWWRPFLLADGGVEPLHDLPRYLDAISSERHAVKALPPVLPYLAVVDSPERHPMTTLLHARTRDAIGADTPFELWAPLLQLDDLLSHDAAYFEQPTTAFGVEFLEDHGLHHHSSGNAGGGTFSGRYRDFLIRVGDETVLFGLRVAATLKAVRDSRYGNRAGRSLLLGCVADGATYHPVLEASVEKELVLSPTTMHLHHSGAITVGKGAVARATMIAFVEEREPRLVRQGRIDLGCMPRTSRAAWEDVAEAFGRLARYTTLRHAFKKQVRATRASRSNS